MRGRLEYDDADLTPGKRKGGGFSQNLFDSDGNLKGSARFIPDEGKNDKPRERRRTRQQKKNGQWRARAGDEAAELLYDVAAEVLAEVMVNLIAEAKPHAKRLWHEEAVPVIEAEARRAMGAARTAAGSAAYKVRQARKPRNTRKASKARRRDNALKPEAKQPIVVEATVVDSGRELAVAEKLYRTDMSSAEAQARYLAALAARAFSDAQMKLVSNANIVDGESLAELQRALVELPPQQVKGVIEAVEANPSVLSGDLLVELGKLLGLDRVESETVPIEKRRISDGARR